MKLYLVILSLLTTPAYGMEKLASKEETKKIEKVALTRYLFAALREWSYLNVSPELEHQDISQLGMGPTRLLTQESEHMTCLPFLQNIDVEFLLQILAYWDYPENALEKENKVIDLYNWFLDKAVDIKALVQGVPKKEDGSLDERLVANTVQEQYKKYSETLLKLSESQAACVMSNELVSFFPFLSAATKFNKEPFLKDAPRQSAVLFKKLLTLIHNYWRRNCGLKASFDRVNEMKGGDYDKACEKEILKGLAVLEMGPATLNEVAELWNMAHFCDIKPLGKALLKMLDSWDRLYLKEFLIDLPNAHLQWICSFIGKSNFVACVIAQKLSFIRANQNLSIEDDLVTQGVAALAQVICRLELSREIPTLWQDDTKTYSRKKIYKLFYDRDLPYTPILFYELLDEGMQNALKQILIKKYMMPTAVRHAQCIKGAYKADRLLNGEREVFYYFNDPSRLNVFAHAGLNLHDSNYTKIWVCKDSFSCIEKFILGNKLETPCAVIGKTDGTVYVRVCSDSENSVRLTIVPQPHWGRVTALCDTSLSLVVAYESGAVQQFYVPLTKGNLLWERPLAFDCNSLTEKYPVELEKGRAILVNDSALENKKYKADTQAEKNYCYSLVANDTYIVGVFKEGCLKVWDNRKDKRIINLPTACEITCMHLMANNHVAVGCNDGAAYVIDLATGAVSNCCQVTAFNKSRVTALAQLGVNGTFLAVGHENGLVHLWDHTSKKIIKTIDWWINSDFSASPVVGFAVSQNNLSVLEVFYGDGLIMEYFFQECATLSEVIRVLRSQSLYG